MVSFDYHTKIYYKDIDQMGHVYYARYFEFFEQARTELLNDLGIIVSEIEDEGYFLPVVSATCDYKEGAKFEDEVIVRTIIKDMPVAKLTINYEIYRESDDHLLVKGHTIHGFIDKDGNPKRPPKSIMDKLHPLISD